MPMDCIDEWLQCSRGFAIGSTFWKNQVRSNDIILKSSVVFGNLWNVAFLIGFWTPNSSTNKQKGIPWVWLIIGSGVCQLDKSRYDCLPHNFPNYNSMPAGLTAWPLLSQASIWGCGAFGELGVQLGPAPRSKGPARSLGAVCRWPFRYYRRNAGLGPMMKCQTHDLQIMGFRHLQTKIGHILQIFWVGIQLLQFEKATLIWKPHPIPTQFFTDICSPVGEWIVPERKDDRLWAWISGMTRQWILPPRRGSSQHCMLQHVWNLEAGRLQHPSAVVGSSCPFEKHWYCFVVGICMEMYWYLYICFVIMYIYICMCVCIDIYIYSPKMSIFRQVTHFESKEMEGMDITRMDWQSFSLYGTFHEQRKPIKSLYTVVWFNQKNML